MKKIKFIEPLSKEGLAQLNNIIGQTIKSIHFYKNDFKIGSTLDDSMIDFSSYSNPLIFDTSIDDKRSIFQLCYRMFGQ